MLLSRLKMDCNYFLNHGNRQESKLYYYDVKRHIEEMKKLYKLLPIFAKPEWLPFKKILWYEKEMQQKKSI
jgi:hypothetical protein